MIFKCLPEFNKCCFCVPLKIGCIIITVYCICSATLYHWVTYKDMTEEYEDSDENDDISCFTFIYNSDCVQSSMGSTGYFVILIIADVCLAAGSLVFLVGICLKKAITATIFLYTFTIAEIPYVFLVIFLLGANMMSKCKVSITGGLVCFIQVIIELTVLFYILCIVKSYRKVMLAENQQTAPSPTAPSPTPPAGKTPTK